MSLARTTSANCPNCNAVQEVSFYSSVNVTVNPELRSKVLNGNLNAHTCSACGETFNIMSGFLYHDMEGQYMINFRVTEESEGDIGGDPMLAELKSKGYIYREVMNYFDLLEKIYVLDLKMNDEVIEEVKEELTSVFKKEMPDIHLQMNLREFKKGLFSKELVFRCFSDPEQVMELKVKLKRLSADKRDRLFDFESLRNN